MSYGVSAYTPDRQRLASVQVGTNGADEVLFAQLLAGYSLTRLPEARRVRGRWWGYDLGFLRAVPRDEWPRPLDATTIGRARRAVAFAYDGCTYISVNRDTMRRGRKLKPVTCPVLAALCDWDDANDEAWRTGNRIYPAGKTAALANVREHVLPQLAESSWFDIVAEFTDVVRAAAKVGGYLRFG